ncbi:MAG: hypothetical protein LHW41_03475 [Candidatus Cloacimonetes bacterium]|nr:hypothetical protein [Candidatus Cloacimonadota bacterium]MDD2489737.1 hypothetical protein [Bacilli bacterium]
MRYYVFAIGGTGARCLESLVFLCAMGLGPKELHPILVDPDSSNGNVNRTRTLITKYKAIRDQLTNSVEGDYFYTDILYEDTEDKKDTKLRIPNVINPNAGLDTGMNTLAHFIEYNNNLSLSDDKYLADLLYSKREMDMDMTEGYRGVPSIGSILMTNVKDHPFWPVLTSALKNDSSSKAFIFASVFGGTGASGYPVISQLLKKAAPNARVGGALLLPYFRLQDPKNLGTQTEAFNNDEILPDSNFFLMNTKAACEFYKNNFSKNVSNYVLGDDLDICSQYENYSKGSADQENNSHMIELFAAYAALDFGVREDGNYKDFYHIQVQNPDREPKTYEVTASDLPHFQKGLVFENFSLFYNYIMDINRLIETSKTSLLNKIAWLRNMKFNGRYIMDHKDELKPLVSFCQSYKQWIQQIHTNSANLNVVSPELRMDCLISENQDKYAGYPISRMDKKLHGRKTNHERLVNAFIKVLSAARVERGK